MASLISCAVLEPFSTTAAYMVAIYQEKAVLKSSDSKAEDSRDGAPQHSRSDVVRSGAFSNGFDGSLEDLVCFSSMESFRRWSNHAPSGGSSPSGELHHHDCLLPRFLFHFSQCQTPARAEQVQVQTVQTQIAHLFVIPYMWYLCSCGSWPLRRSLVAGEGFVAYRTDG